MKKQLLAIAAAAALGGGSLWTGGAIAGVPTNVDLVEPCLDSNFMVLLEICATQDNFQTVFQNMVQNSVSQTEGIQDLPIADADLSLLAQILSEAKNNGYCGNITSSDPSKNPFVSFGMQYCPEFMSNLTCGYVPWYPCS
jgi:hypothetical protein